MMDAGREESCLQRRVYNPAGLPTSDGGRGLSSMMTRTRRRVWLLLAAAAGAALLWVYVDRARPPTVRLLRRSPLVGVVPQFRTAPTLQRVPPITTTGDYDPADRTVLVEISEYAGYAGLIMANGGLEPSEDSVFFRDHNFRVRLNIREEQNFERLNAGALGAVGTTADVVAVYGANLNAVVPLLIGYSRGADAIVTRRDITGFDGLKGKIVVTSQFTEAEFLVRHMATRTGIGVKLLPSVDATPDPEDVNIAFAADAFDACDMLLAELVLSQDRISGCAAWEPRTSGTVQRSGGAAHFLMTSRNLLMIADVLVVNRGLAERHPEIVAGLIEGIVAGNQIVRESPESVLSEIAAAFHWSRDKTRDELAKVQPATLADNLRFFSGGPDEIGSFAHIFQSATAAYGDVIDDPSPPAAMLDMRHLQELQSTGRFPERGVPPGRLRSLVDETDPIETLPPAEVVPTRRVLPMGGIETQPPDATAAPPAGDGGPERSRDEPARK